MAPVRRPARYLGDPDALQALLVAALLLVLSAGLAWLAYLLHVWRTAARAPLEPSARKVVLVFGRRLVADRPEAEYRARLARALTLARTGRAGRVLLLGGLSAGRVTEAAAGLAWLGAQGFPRQVALTPEQESVDSLENLRGARRLLADAGGALPEVALVTSRYHLARCRLLARRLGFRAELVGAEPRLPRTPRYAARLVLEASYLMWIDVGLRWARLTGNARMAARIS